MARSRLRVYYGPEPARATKSAPKKNDQTVQLPLSEVFPLLAEAIRSERTWLRDFEHDEITISTDLYEVLRAYQFCCRPSA
ncbi:MAG TPA: hypothetical protein VND64_00240 [Pirellulales bacterium]|jgi:hypothetical protein|nr:hypothetical protein [Pirellulales bacterium]